MGNILSPVENFELFSRRVDELYERRLVREGMNAKLTISWNLSSQLIKRELDQPDEEDLRSFLLLFRQFVSDKEPIFLSKIINDCLRYLKSDEIKQEMRKAQDTWKQILYKMGPFQLVIDAQHFSGEYVLDLWINGYYFHNDSDKAVELNRYLSSQDLILVRMHLLSSLAGLTQIIMYVGNVVKHGLREDMFDF